MKKFGKHSSGEQSSKGGKEQVMGKSLKGENSLLSLLLSNFLCCLLISQEALCWKCPGN